MKIPAYALTDNELWAPALVLPAIVQALRVFRSIPISIGPAKLKAFFPDAGGDDWPENDERYRPKRGEVDQAYKVLVGFEDGHGRPHPAWLNGSLVGYPDQRSTLSRWAKWASHGKVDFDGISMTEEEFARGIHLSKSTMIRQRDFAAGVVAQSLNEAELAVWHVSEPARRKNRSISSSAAA